MANGRTGQPWGSLERNGDGIGVLNESSLHAAVKAWYARPGDVLERDVKGYVVDIVRGDLLIEVQTGGFASMRDKLRRLLSDHPVRLVYPLAMRTWIVRVTPQGELLGQRRSPRRGRLEDLFDELVYIPDLITHDGLTVEVLQVHQEEIRCVDGRGSWRRRGQSIVDRRLLEVVRSERFAGSEDWLATLPEGLPEAFTNRDLARCAGIPLRRAGRMSYVLRHAGLLEQVGSHGNAHVYSLSG